MSATPIKWAARLSQMLKAFHDIHPDINRFPINVINVSKEYSRALFPAEPITLIEGADFSEAFEGALIPNPTHNGEWAILYNNGIKSKGRINFTLAHEFGHYLIHRHLLSQGQRCTRRDMLNWRGSEALIETEANVFASNFLMPAEDFAKQIYNNEISKALILSLAERYDVSITAAALRWLQLCKDRAMIISSRDGFIDWAWSNEKLIRSGTYLAPKQHVIELPSGFLLDETACERVHAVGVWDANEAVKEILLYNNDEFALLLLIYPKINAFYDAPEEKIEEIHGMLNF